MLCANRRHPAFGKSLSLPLANDRSLIRSPIWHRTKQRRKTLTDSMWGLERSVIYDSGKMWKEIRRCCFVLNKKAFIAIKNVCVSFILLFPGLTLPTGATAPNSGQAHVEARNGGYTDNMRRWRGCSPFFFEGIRLHCKLTWAGWLAIDSMSGSDDRLHQ